MIKIDTQEQYDYAVRRGYEPLMDWRFYLDIALRVDIQRNLFGLGGFDKKSRPQANQRFYEWVWNRKPHVCEEFMIPLMQYSAKFISHILTRGAHPEMAHDPRNVNILSFKAHQKWEDATKRKYMRIYAKNIRIIQFLKNDYLNLKKTSYG